MKIHMKITSWLFVVMVLAIFVSAGVVIFLKPAAQASTETKTPAPSKPATVTAESCCHSGEHDQCCPHALATGSRACCAGGETEQCCTGKPGECCCKDKEQAKDTHLPRLELLDNPLVFVRAEKKPLGGGKASAPETKTLADELRRALLNHQRGLKDAYVCCTVPGCVFCQTASDSCPCGTNLRKGEAVCPECWGGWQAGQGAIPAVRKDDVKIFSKETLKTLYETRAKKFDQALEGGSPEKK
jgi:hypothetical protein